MDPTLSQILMFGGNFQPRGWMFCNGQILSIAEYTAVFALVGTTYGGDGQVTFGLPDMRGRMGIGTGNGAGLPGVVLGQMAGTPSVTLLQSQLPAHNHPVKIPTTSANGSAKTPGGNIVAASNNTYGAVNTQDSNYGGVNVRGEGGNIPVDIRIPYLGLNFIFCMEGVFPSRN